MSISVRFLYFLFEMMVLFMQLGWRLLTPQSPVQRQHRIITCRAITIGRATAHRYQFSLLYRHHNSQLVNTDSGHYVNGTLWQTEQSGQRLRDENFQQQRKTFHSGGWLMLNSKRNLKSASGDQRLISVDVQNSLMISMLNFVLVVNVQAEIALRHDTDLRSSYAVKWTAADVNVNLVLMH